MTQLLQDVFEKASRLPEMEQDELARLMLAELESEERWSEAFSRTESEDLLERMADEALRAHRVGDTVLLDPKHL